MLTEYNHFSNSVCSLMRHLHLVRCICLLSALSSDMDEFIDSYDEILGNKKITRFTPAEKITVLSSIALLLRRHNADNKLCCHNNENDLEVTDVDHYGFVTYVKCKKCKQTIDTECHDAKWTYERVQEDALKPGDHICWHRPYLIWHHAIVTQVGLQKKVIHYSSKFKVEPKLLSKVHCDTSSCCDDLYRINYQDCYDADYTILRAQKLVGEKRYDLLERNCEHIGRWCKTGSAKSSQVSILWTSLGKAAVAIGLRLLALIILAILQYSHEAQEDQVKNRQQLERLETWLIILYIIITTLVFTIYLLVTSCSRLAIDPARVKRPDIENPLSFSKKHANCTKDTSNSCTLCCCCFWFGCFNLFVRVMWSLWFCKHIKHSPRTCCRRRGSLACGIFCRIFWREIPAVIVTLIVLVYEEAITNADGIVQMSAAGRTSILILISAAAYTVVYSICVFFARWLEACCS